MSSFLTKKERLVLRAAHQKEHYRRFADRIKVILALDSGRSVQDIADMLLIDPETVRSYRKKYEAEGLEGLCQFSYEGRESLLSCAQEKELSKELRSRIYLCTGEVLSFIEEKFGIRYSPSGVTALLHRLGFSYKKPCLVPGKADRKAQEEFLEMLALGSEQGKELKISFITATAHILNITLCRVMAGFPEENLRLSKVTPEGSE